MLSASHRSKVLGGLFFTLCLGVLACEEDTHGYREDMSIDEDIWGEGDEPDSSLRECSLSDCTSEAPLLGTDGMECYCNAACMQRDICCDNAATTCARIWELAGGG
jgi:hypothetical protein